MKETYNTKELAALVGVPWQTIASWKRYGKIPENAITPEGEFKKSVIDPIIESGVFERPEPDAAPSRKKTRPSKKTKGAKKKASLRKQNLESPTTLPARQQSVPAKPKKEISFDDFARSYWQEGTRAVDVLLLSPDTSALVVKHVNNALRFAFEKLK